MEKTKSFDATKRATEAELIQNSARAKLRAMAFIWSRVLWPFSSALNIYGIYYLENRRKQAKIQGNIHNGTDILYERQTNTSFVYYYKNRHLL